jgi:MFS family permease
VTTNHRGIVSTFGAFQTYYELNHLSHKSASQISWIGSTQAFLLLLVGVLTGPLYDWGYFRTLIFAGCFLEVFGMMMVSICREYWQAVLAQALLVGVGCGCTFIPSVAILPSYFSTKKGLANGIAASGSGFGNFFDRGDLALV